MKTTPYLLLACALIQINQAKGQLVDLSWPIPDAMSQVVDVNRTIPDNDASGLVSTLDVSTEMTSIESITITLNISNAPGDSVWNGDLYAYVTHDSGASTGFTVLLNRPGLTGSNADGYGDHGFSITLSDSAPSDIHHYQSVTHSFDASGRLVDVWKPDARGIPPTSSGSSFDSAARNADFSSFSGLDPNGLWVLFISDRASGNVGTLDSWSLSITAVPEPRETATVVGVMLFSSALVMRLRRSRLDHQT